uniref:Uncharacterized protein n=1 Tax=Romanomermis culicivorax TaxID=13658 RepID=A0A915KD01_ROMCU
MPDAPRSKMGKIVIMKLDYARNQNITVALLPDPNSARYGIENANLATLGTTSHPKCDRKHCEARSVIILMVEKIY